MTTNILSKIAACATNKNLTLALNGAVFLNCFSHVILSKMREKPDLVHKLEQEPISTCVDVVVEGTMYSLAGLVVSNVFAPHTNILFNSIMLYSNYRQWCDGKNIIHIDSDEYYY